MYFLEPLKPGWIYPCTLDEIRTELENATTDELDGLNAVGLSASTRKDSNANGRYHREYKPSIHIYSFPESFTFKITSKQYSR